MILVAGGTGHLGSELVPHLVNSGIPVRVLTRDPDQARRRLGEAPQLARGDVRNLEALKDAMDGIDAVVSAITGFGPTGPGPLAVDFEGNLNLITAAQAAGVKRFVLVSMHGAAADHPMELARMKFRAEDAVRASPLDWVIVRPNAFMELWAEIVGEPIVKQGKATVFGRGDNPINFNSTKDVARFVDLALFDSRLSRTVLDIGGPDNLTFNQLVSQIESASGRKSAVRHIPLSMMRLSSLVMRPFRPGLAGMIQGGIAFETVDMAFDVSDLQRRFPQVELTRMADILDRKFAAVLPL